MNPETIQQMIDKVSEMKEELSRREEAKEKAEKERKHQELVDAIKESKITKDEMVKAVSEIKLPKIDTPIVPEIKIPEVKLPNITIPEIKIPEIKIPDITVPDIKIPEIKVPEVKIPQIKVPKIEMPDKMTVDGEVSLKNVAIDNPLPVQLRDSDGNPVSLNTIISQSGGGGSRGTVGISQSSNGTTNKVTAQLIDESGTPYGVKHIQNKVRTSSMPYLYDIAEGNVPNHEPWGKMGFNDNIGTTEETMWANSTQYVFPTVAGQMEVVSSDNTQDNSTGTGARTVRIGYLKSDYSEGSVTLTLNGTTAVPTGASHADIWRINSFRVMTTGSNGSPIGNLTLRVLGGGATHGYIRAGKTRARSCFYTVPLGKTLYVTSIAFAAAGTKYLIFTTHANYDNATGTILQRGLFYPYSEVTLLNGSYTKTLEIPTKLPATTDLKVSVVAEAAGSIGTCNLRGWLE